MADGTVSYGRIFDFRAEVAEAHFIFPPSVVGFLDRLISLAIEVHSLHERLCPDDGSAGLELGDERSRVAREIQNKLVAIREQFDRLNAVFHDHLFDG